MRIDKTGKPGDVPTVLAGPADTEQDDVYEVLMTDKGYSLFMASSVLLEAAKWALAAAEQSAKEKEGDGFYVGRIKKHLGAAIAEAERRRT